MQQGFRMIESIRTAHIPDTSSFAIIEDMSRIGNISIAVRKEYIRYIGSVSQVQGVVLYNVTVLQKFMVRLGILGQVFPFPIHVAQNYAHAVDLAGSLTGLPKAENFSDDRIAILPTTSFLWPGGPIVQTHLSWRIEHDTFQTIFQVIDSNILHSDTTGVMTEDHIPEISALREKVHRETLGNNGFRYIIANASGIDGGSWQARKGYIQSMVEWHSRFPFSSYMVYGANRFMRTAIRMAGLVMPFKVILTESLNDALSEIQRMESIKSLPMNTHQAGLSPSQTFEKNDMQRHIEEILNHLAGFTWNTPDPMDVEPYPPDHPFQPVFEAINILNQELKDLLEERKQAEDALKDSEAKYRLIAEQTSDYISMSTFEAQPEYTYVSPSHQRFGYSLDELIGKSPFDFIHPDDREQLLIQLLNYLSQFQNGELAFHPVVQETLEYRFKNKEGQWLHLESTANLVSDRYILFVTRDVTHRWHTEQALRKSEEWYRQLMNTAQDMIVTADLNGHPTLINPAALQATGYSLEEAMAIKISQILAPEYVDQWEVFLTRIQAAESSHRWYELDIVAKDGRRIPVEVSTVLLTENDEPSGLLIIARNITNRKQAEQERLRMEEQLRATQRLESIGLLAGGVAHDFNNILTGIQGRTSLMQFSLEPTHPHHKYLRDIETLVDRAAGLTRQLLGFARAGKYEVKPTRLSELLRTSAEMFNRTRKDLRIHHDHSPELYMVAVDQGQMDQVLMNLFINAGLAMPAGGDLFLKTVNIHLVKSQARSLSVKEGPFVLLTVGDTGVGIEASILPKIFDPFFSTREVGKGSGLGLASAYGIIKNHDGAIQVDSQPGQGTTFSIFLPAIMEQHSPVQLSASFAEIHGNGTLMLVEDEELVRDVAVSMLEYLGYQVIPTKGGKEAIQVYQQHWERIDLVILSMVMPDMNGVSTVNALKSLNSDVRILLSSGYSENGQAAEMLGLGCCGFIQKPFQLATLSQKIVEALEPGSG
jgi:PAS domain S-box-containing protein